MKKPSFICYEGKMSVYLNDIPLAQALARFQAALKEAGLGALLGEEEIALDEHAAGRVLSAPVWAQLSNPRDNAAAMDGFAVRSSETHGAAPSNPLVLTFGTQAIYLDTGEPLPQWADAVIPIENVESLGSEGLIAEQIRRPEAIRIRAVVTPWSHVRPMGEDIVATQLVLPAGQVLRPVDLGALAASGQVRLKVARKPNVAVLPTGSELAAIGRELQAGELVEFNSLVLAAQVNGWGGTAKRYPITSDDFDQICRRVQEAAQQSDLILLNAGSSAGSEDFSAQVIEKLGRLLVHGVAVRPGHPVILGMVPRVGGSLVPIIGVPGFPVSAALTGEIFVEPLLMRWQGRVSQIPQEQIDARLTRKVTSPPGDDDYVRMAVGRVGEQVLAAPLARGAGMITSLVHADGIVIIPSGTQGLEAGSKVKVRLYRSAAEIEKTIFAIGSHDLTLDLLAQYLVALDRRLVSVNAGSQGGLVALRRGEAHLAGSHLLDAESGEYNLTAIRQYLPDTPVSVFGWVGRKQGLLVRRGNPKRIASLADLVRSDVSYVNRQRGAGTRVLLDYHLSRLGIRPESIQGYDREEYTHLAIAAAVSSGRADCGLGVAAAAQALDLDFLPMFDEQYQVIIPRTFLEGPLLGPFFEVAQNPEFQQAIMALPGYDISQMGLKIADLG